MSYSSSQGEECDWAVFSEDGQLRGQSSGHGDPGEAVRAIDGARLVMLVPGADVLLTTASVPNVGRRQQEKAVPYAMEDRLATEVEDLHFVLGDSSEDGTHVAVTSRERMQQWLSPMGYRAGLEQRMIPDVLAVPRPDNGWGVLLQADRVLVRTGAQSGFSTEPGSSSIFLQAALARQTPPAVMRVHGGDGQMLADIENFCSEHGIALDRRAGEASPLMVFANGLREGGGIDLLQGAFAMQEAGADLWRRWRMLVYALAAVLLLHVVFVTGDYLRLKSADASLKQDIEQAYREAFPDARNVTRPRKQMQDKLAALRAGGGSGDGFIVMLGEVAAPLAKMNANLQRGDYREGRLDLNLLVPSLQALDAFKQSIEGEGRLSVQILSAGKRDGQTDARLRITRRGR